MQIRRNLRGPAVVSGKEPPGPAACRRGAALRREDLPAGAFPLLRKSSQLEELFFGEVFFEEVFFEDVFFEEVFFKEVLFEEVLFEEVLFVELLLEELLSDSSSPYVL